MEKENIIKKNTERKSVALTIRITPKLSKWMHENKYSPTAILTEATKDLGFKQ